jgi:hypothetical protein
MRFTPHLSARLIPGWFPKESLEFLTPDRRGHLMVSSEFLPPGANLASFVGRYGRALSQAFSNYQEHSVEPGATFLGQEAVVRRFSWNPTDGVAVTYLHMYCVANGLGYLATGTARSEVFPEVEPELLRLVDGLRLAPFIPLAVEAQKAGAREGESVYERFENGQLQVELPQTDAQDSPGTEPPPADWQQARRAWEEVTL